MEELSALERSRAYLETLDEEAENTTNEEEYFELLGPGEVLDLLTIRDILSRCTLGAHEQAEVSRLDDLLIKHQWLVTGNIPPYPDVPRSRWWWHLHEGPQVREEAIAAGAVEEQD